MMEFIKELKEARLIRTKDDLKFTYREVCDHAYIILLTLDFLSKIKQGKDIAQKYAKLTASYINYKEFRTSATDLYNLIYFIEETPENVETIFGSEDSKKLRMQTQIPRMELNRWLLKLDDNNKDLYFLMRLEQALNVNSSELKDIRRILQFRNPSPSDIRQVSSRIMNVIRFKMPLLDLRQEIEDVLNNGKITYIKEK